MRLYIVLAVVMLAGSWAAYVHTRWFQRHPIDSLEPLSDEWRPNA